MAQAQSYATAAALSHLGYTVHATDAGALVYAVEPGSPAGRVASRRAGRHRGGHHVDTDPFRADHRASREGAREHGLAHGGGELHHSVGRVVPGPTVHRSVRLDAPPRRLAGGACGMSAPTAYLGISPEQQQDWHFPVDVTVHTQDIGGPSAGLAMTLGIMDKLSTGRLTGPRIVAATGTIDSNGNVGDVGGVAEKTIAVERAGASVFFVPSVELATARSKAGPQLHVYGVGNLSQVLRILHRLGGGVPTNPVSAQAAP